MSVYTVVPNKTLQCWLAHYPVGQLLDYEGIAAGITNTNYFVTTTHGRYVLTLFESLTLDQLPFYLQLMRHLSQHGIACPTPIADHGSQLASMLASKPACLTSCLAGQDITHPNTQQCYTVGAALADLHQVGLSYPLEMDNPRGSAWCARIAPTLYQYMPPEDQQSLAIEIKLQQNQQFSRLPSGIVHADLFKDNVLMEGNRITGFIDFYYACNESLLYDVAIAINDWARGADGHIDDALASAFLDGYQSIRQLIPVEKQAWPSMLRAAALRFWISRLLDTYQPQPGAMTYTKDPQVFQRLSEAYRQRIDFWL